MSDKYTPGPWVWTVTDLERDNPEDDNFYPVIELDIVDGKPALKMTYPDRSLIAAAPDLLEDLESRYIETHCGCGHPACKCCKGDDETARLIARAEGKLEQ